MKRSRRKTRALKNVIAIGALVVCALVAASSPNWVGVTIGLVIILALLAMLIAMSVRHGTVRERIRQNRCIACGYLLTGNISGICPECGTPVALSPPARGGAEASRQASAGERTDDTSC